MDYYPEKRPPSFSASLLDAIYRSLDGGTPEIERAATRHSKPRPQPDPLPQKKKSHSDIWWASAKRKPSPPSYTSSDTSSYGFSSDAEPPKAKPAAAKVNRIQFHNPPALPMRTPPQEKKKKSNPFRKKWRELRNGRPRANSSSISASTRTGSPLSKFLKAIFSSSRTQKTKKTAMSAPQKAGGIAVPVLVPAPPSEETEDVDMAAEAVKTRVEEILRGLEKDKGAEEEDDSDDSSDLFELENLTEIGSHELPVYCTTSLVANHPAVFCK
jgi:hypothetical protein